MPIRNSVKAIVVQDGKILLTKNQDNEGVFYLCPGGGQEYKEDFCAALNRECLEEVGASVEIGELQFIREYIGERHEYAESDADVHQVEFYFSCKIKDLQGGKPVLPDEHQIGTEWVPLEELTNLRVYPMEMRENLLENSKGKKTPIYLGCMN